MQISDVMYTGILTECSMDATQYVDAEPNETGGVPKVDHPGLRKGGDRVVPIGCVPQTSGSEDEQAR